MKSNDHLQKEVQNMIMRDSFLTTSAIKVSALDGVITLSGVVDSLRKKFGAVEAAKNVTGVTSVIEQFEIQLSVFGQRDDSEITHHAARIFQSDQGWSAGKIMITVNDGWITMEGEAQSTYQKDAAKDLMCNITGVKGVTDNITIRPPIVDVMEKKQTRKRA